jgi:beta-galactosidase
VFLAEQEAPDHFFRFEVPNCGETQLVAVAGECRDESTIRKVEVFNEAYRLQEKNAILNWFEITMPEGYLSINDKLSDIMATVRGKMLFMKLAGEMMASMPKSKDGKPSAMGFELTSSMMEMVGSFTVLRLAGMVGMANITITKEQLLELNAQLNKIKKKEGNCPGI